MPYLTFAFSVPLHRGLFTSASRLVQIRLQVVPVYYPCVAIDAPPCPSTTSLQSGGGAEGQLSAGRWDLEAGIK